MNKAYKAQEKNNNHKTSALKKQQAETHIKTLTWSSTLKPTMPFSNASFPAFGCTPQIQRYAKTKDAGRSERKEASVHLY